MLVQVGFYAKVSTAPLKENVSVRHFRFTVNLTCGLNQAPMDDIALAFSPSYQQGLVVVNHLKKQVWGQPLQVQNVIQKGQNFEMIILCEAHQFKVMV